MSSLIRMMLSPNSCSLNISTSQWKSGRWANLKVCLPLSFDYEGIPRRLDILKYMKDKDMQNLSYIDMTEVSIYKNATDVKGSSMEIMDILKWIWSGENGLKEAITDIRNTSDDEQVKAMKRGLPMFTPNGTFSYRNSQSLQQYSNFMVLDFDFQDNNSILAFKQKLIQYADPLHLGAVWLSPKHGVKALMLHDNIDPNYHYNLFWRVKKNLYPNTPEFDTNCSDLCRTCYLSYDPEIFINYSPYLQPYHFEFDQTISQQPAQKNYTSSVSGYCGGEFIHTAEEITLNQKFQNRCSDKTLMNMLIKDFNSQNPDYYKDANRHNGVKRRAVIYCKDGVLYDNAVWSLVGQFGERSKAGLNDDDVRGMVSGCYKNARGEFGRERNKYLQMKGK